MPLDFGGISQEQFFAEYWRKKPIHVKGGARRTLGFELTQARFRAIVDRLDRESPAHVSRTGDGTIFVQYMDVASAELSHLSTRFARELSCRRVWFDGVWAVGNSGIGSHYDHSDNFVLQQSGTKIWRLAPPTYIPEAELRERMLDEPGVGPIHMPDDALEFVVEAGDLLYIPLFWVHWGVSVGESLSISLVFNADNPLNVLLPALGEVLSRNRSWWYPFPLSRGGGDGASGPGEQVAREADALFDQLLDQLADPAIREDAKRAWLRHGYAPQAGMGTKDERRRSRYGGAAQDGEPLMEVGALDAIIQARPEPMDVAALARLDCGEEPRDQLLVRSLQGVFRHLREVAVEGARFIRQDELRATTRRLFSAMSRMGIEAVSEAVLRPELMLWTWRAYEAVDSNYVPRVEEVFEHLGTLLLPFLVATETLEEGRPLRLTRSTPRTLHLHAIGRRLVLDAGLPRAFTATRRLGPLHLQLDGGRSIELEPDLLTADGRELEIAPGVRLETFPRVGGAVAFVAADDWITGFWPRGGRFGVAPLEPGGSRAGLWRVLDAAVEIVRGAWPGAWETVAARTELIAPLDPEARAWLAGAAPPALGLLGMREAPPEALARALVREAGHDLFNTLLGGVDLLENREWERHETPFAPEPCALSDTFRSLYGAIQVMELDARTGRRDLALATQATHALDLLRARARLHPGGESLLDALAGRLRALRESA